MATAVLESAEIDARAVVDPRAKIADGVKIGPFSIIGPDVDIGEGTDIGPHVVIEGPCRIGKYNRIAQFSSLGGAPQHLGYKGEPTELIIGDHNIIREFVSLNRGTVQGHGKTVIGNHNFFMAYTHVAHDCRVGNHIIFANNAQLAGHVTIDDHVTLGAYTGIHQFVHIGSYSFLGRATKIVQDILPFMMVQGNPGAPCGLNSIGLKRKNFSDDSIRQLKRAYKIIFRQGLLLQEALNELQVLAADCEEIRLLIQAIERADRGIARG